MCYNTHSYIAYYNFIKTSVVKSIYPINKVYYKFKMQLKLLSSACRTSVFRFNSKFFAIGVVDLVSTDVLH